MAKFPESDIISLTQESLRFDLAESVGPDLRLGGLFNEAALGDLAHLPLGYGTAQGDPKLRGTIAERHAVQPEEVVVTVGGMHALFLLSFLLCDRGQEAVTTAPLFPLARNVLEGVGASVRTLPLSFDGGYRIAPAALEPLLTPRTKLVLLASPQNPSGVAISPADGKALAALIAEKSPNAVLVMDETYREAAYGDAAVAESAVHFGANVVACTSLSKCHGAPGLRLGWIVVRDSELRQQLVLGKFNTVISNSAIDEALALKVLNQQERIVGERRAHLADGLARTEAWVAQHAESIEWRRPDAGALCCLRLKPEAFDDAAVQRFYEALASEQVRVAPGTWFGDEARVFRLGFGLLPMPELDAGLAALSAALRKTLPLAA